MALTPEQLAALKVAIDADSALAALENTLDNAIDVIAKAFNQPAVPDYVVWKTQVTRKEILQSGFDWTRLDNLSVGKARVWTDIFIDGVIDPSKPNVRTGIDSVWVGTAPDLAVRNAVYVHCKRKATRREKLFAAGAGTTASPATMSFEGEVTADEVVTARNLT